MAAPRLRWAVVSVLVVVVAAVAVIVVRHGDGTGCSYDTRVKAVSHLQSPAQMKNDHNQRFDKLVESVSTMGPPFGSVRAGFAYPDLHLFPAGNGVLAFVKNDTSPEGDFGPVTFLDGRSLEPRWALKPSSPRFSFALTQSRFVTFNPTDSQLQVSSYELASGKSVWCTSLPITLAQFDPLTTTTLDDGDLVVEVGHVGARGVNSTVELWLLSQKTGTLRWHRELAGAGQADFLGQLDGSTVLVGGSPSYALGNVQSEGDGPLTAPSLRHAAGSVLTAVAVSNGRSTWSYDPGPNAVVHVLGVDDGHSILLVLKRSGPVLVALSLTGHVLWQRQPLMQPFFDASLHNSVVITTTLTGSFDPREPSGGPTDVLHGYDAATGVLLWSQPLEPDGSLPSLFTLDEVPSLDADHLLVPTDGGLNVLDLRTGANGSRPLPGPDPDRPMGAVSSYAPDHVLVTDHLLGIMTPNGAVIAERDGSGR